MWCLQSFRGTTEGARYLEDGKLTVFKRSGVYCARIRLHFSIGYRSQNILASALEMSGATGGLKFVHGHSPLREVGGGNDDKFRPAHYLAQHWLLGVNAMRSVLALGLLIALCASANAAKVHDSKPHAVHVRSAQPVAFPKGYAVPGWTEKQTRDWMDSLRGGTD